MISYHIKRRKSAVNNDVSASSEETVPVDLGNGKQSRSKQRNVELKVGETSNSRSQSVGKRVSATKEFDKIEIPAKRNKKGNVKSVVKINKPAPAVTTATFIENDEVVRMDVENDDFLSETEEGELPQDEEIVEEIYEIPGLVDEQDSAEDTEANDDEDDEVVIRRK